MNLFWSYNQTVDNAYIIRIEGNAVSEKLAKNCAESCDRVGQKYVYWPAYDGHKDKILPPANESSTMNLIKVTDHYLTRGEVACALSHISLWDHCVQTDKPLVVLEHDAVMLQAYASHALFNSICFLGCHEQVEKGWGVFPTPVHGTEGPNFHFIGRAHAYAIDPTVAKNLLSHVIKHGICAPLDMIMRADIFPIHQMGVFAQDCSLKETTILGRPENGRTTKRNDFLTY